MEPEIKTRPFFFGPCPHSHGLVVRMCVYLDLKTSEGRCKKRKVKLFKGFYFPFSPRSTPPLHFSAAKIEGFSPPGGRRSGTRLAEGMIYAGRMLQINGKLLRCPMCPLLLHQMVLVVVVFIVRCVGEEDVPMV